MKFRILTGMMSLCLLLTVLLCACDSAPAPTVITKAPENVVIRTDPTTTTTTTTTTTVANDGATTPSSDSNSTAGGSTTTTAPVIIDGEGSTEKGKAIAELAVSLIGTPFKNGANGPDAFDNPSFVVYCYKQNGYTVPRKASSMAEYGQEVPADQLQVGDILVFCNNIGGKPDFCGIYIGNKQFVSCNNPNSPTKIQKLSLSYWTERFITARRPTE
ncbi:MAG: C40 family peptidase [Clostridia bacterium]|nr:C40 family peptidase [Clostridia bacterium]